MPPPAKAESQRTITLGGQPIAYLLRRSTRRSIGLTIDHNGLRVAAPLRATLGEIEQLLRKHAHWVLEKLAARRERPAPLSLAVEDGGHIFVLGEALTVKVSPAARFRWQIADACLHLHVPATASNAAALEAALRAHARPIFAQRLAHYAAQLGVPPPPLRLSSARTRWGSCNHRGGISLNWRLILQTPAALDYVVCHELAHLKEMNHSPRFWAIVEQLYPDWRTQRKALLAVRI